MNIFISNKEISEIAISVVTAYHNDPMLTRVDVDGLATRLLRLNVLYEDIREYDKDKIAYTSNGTHPLTVSRQGHDVDILFPKDTIILDRFLLNCAEEKRRRFVLAHEIGHVLCSRADPHHSASFFNRVYDSERQYTYDELRERMTLAEMQANNMAGTLLMPRYVLLNVMKKFGVNTQIPVYGEQVFMPEEKVLLHNMSETLAVSHTTLLIQLKKEGLLQSYPMKEYIEKVYQSDY